MLIYINISNQHNDYILRIIILFIITNILTLHFVFRVNTFAELNVVNKIYILFTSSVSIKIMCT
ncbi:hypothetical protein BGH98_01925 [Snodgrassella alvi]|nr:hypothetical protein BGH98_01925 [Snodgrassella alvi]ORF10677.1 hypothetical protein BGI01_10205 [Snodgrassella alvi]ORF22371.1 hypothetical protein BGI04_01005 [Snodgrassella alvi]